MKKKKETKGIGIKNQLLINKKNMSVRAYRINKIDREGNPSFNLWNDQKLMTFIEEIDFTEFDGYNGGMVEISVDALKKALEKKEELELDKEMVDQIKKDIKDAEKKNSEFILYECF